MSTWVDYKAIRACVTMEHVLEHYGVLDTLHEKGDSLVGVCPIHKGTNPNQFHVSRAKNNFMCFGNCHQGGNVIDFVVLIEGGDKESMEDVRAAALKIMDWFGLEFDRPPGGRRTKGAPLAPALAMASVVTTVPAADPLPASQPTLPLAHTTGGIMAPVEPAQAPLTDAARPETNPPVVTMPEATAHPVKVNTPLKFALKKLDASHPYVIERGFTPETIAHFGLGYCAKGIMAGRIAIPIHNERGELVAYAGRWPGEPPEGEGKYKLPMGFHKSLVVYNLHRAREEAKEGELIMVEGFFDCLRVWSAGFPNVIALMGSVLSDEQATLIVDAVGPNGKVALMFDEDEAGWKGREDALSRLSSRVYVKIIGLGDEGRQPDTVPEAELKKALLGF